MGYRRKVDYKALNASKKFCNEDVISVVAKELNIDPELVREVLEIQSNFTATRMRSGGLERIIYPFLGSFNVNHKRVQKMMANEMKH